MPTSMVNPTASNISICSIKPCNPATGVEAIEAMVPMEHRSFVQDLLPPQRYRTEGRARAGPRDHGLRRRTPAGGRLQTPDSAHRQCARDAPPMMIERARHHGVPVAALVGAKEHAIRQINAGVDVIVAQGSEAGGHCGEVSTLVLIPEVIAAISKIRRVPVPRRRIMTGRQMAGMMAMGAAGASTGSVWPDQRL